MGNQEDTSQEKNGLETEDISENGGQAESPSRIKRLIKRFGVAGFLFFFIKGVVLYILIPLGLFKWFGGC